MAATRSVRVSSSARLNPSFPGSLSGDSLSQVGLGAFPPILNAMSVKALALRGSSRGGLARALRRNGIPRDPDLNEPLPKRLLKNKFFWLTVVMILVYATMLVLLYRAVVPDREVPGGTLPGLGTEAIPIALKYAAITAIPLSLLFLWA